MGKIESQKIVLKDLFSEKFWFAVPDYQRSYVWQEDNIHELIDDLTYAFEYKNDAEYFLGSIVLKKTDRTVEIDNQHFDFTEYEVLDGQQRLTTLFLMLAVLRDLLDKQNMKDMVQKYIYQEEEYINDIPERQRIVYNVRDDVEDFIKAYVIQENGTLKLDELKEIAQSKKYNISKVNMANALITFHELLADRNNLLNFVKFIATKVLIIYVSTDNQEDAFRLFTILNNRGIPLTSADILKSTNIGALPDKKKREASAKYWEELESRYGDNFDRFLNFIRTILVKEKARANLLDEFEEKIYKKQLLQKGQETLQLIRSYDEVYTAIIDLEDMQLSNQIKNLVTTMKFGFRSEDWIPPVMGYFKKFKHESLLDFISKLERKFGADWIIGISPTKRLDAMNDILKAIEDATCADEVVNHSTIFSFDVKVFSDRIQDDIYGKQFARYLLLKIEYLLSDHTSYISNYTTLSVEHVLPQNPADGSHWWDMFDEDQHWEWVDKLANLILLSKKKNSSLSNLDFIDKKARYLKGRIDNFKSTKIFIEQQNEWNPKVLQKRQDELVEMLIREK